MSKGPVTVLLQRNISFIYSEHLKEDADQEANVYEKTGICTQTILVQT